MGVLALALRPGVGPIIAGPGILGHERISEQDLSEGGIHRQSSTAMQTPECKAHEKLPPSSPTCLPAVREERSRKRKGEVATPQSSNSQENHICRLSLTSSPPHPPWVVAKAPRVCQAQVLQSLPHGC